MIRIKNAIRIFEKSNLQANYYSNDGIYPFYTSSQNLTKKCDVALFPEDSITMGTGGQASVNYSDVPFSTSTDCFNFQSIFGKDYTKFIYYYLLAHIDEINSLGFQGMGLKHLQKDFIYNLEFDENLISKEKISYLDCLSQRINALITNEEKQIKKLKEYKQALISEVVTKGLDPNASMKDSGVIELGKISQNYILSIASSVIDIERGGSPRPIDSFYTDAEDGISWIKIGDTVHGSKYITKTKNKITLEGARKSKFVKPGDFLLTNSMSFGRPYISDIYGCVHDGWLILRPKLNVYNVDFLFYLLSSNGIVNQFTSSIDGAVVSNLNIDKVKKSILVIPPYIEQDKIAKYLDKKSLKIDSIINCHTSKIEKLKQYRQSMIYEYVTGKRKVY